MDNCKGQGWGLDLMLASTIFLMGLIVFYFYSINNPAEDQETFQSLSHSGDIIAESLFSEGYPKHWNTTTVVNIGVLSDNKVNATKLESFYNLTYMDYNRTKNIFKTKYDFYFFFTKNMTVNGTEVVGIGKEGTDKDNITSENLIKVTRFTIYENEPITAYIYVWD